jgi:hypothetical protein
MASSFSEFTKLYQSIVSSVTNPKDYFSSDEYLKFEQSAEVAYIRAEPLCKPAIKVLQGIKKGEEIGFPYIEREIGFYNRILKQPAEMLSAEIRKAADVIINDMFLLGLISHLFLFDCPSRSGFENVDIRAVMNGLIPKILSSSGKMRKYNKEFNTVPVLIFEKYYEINIAPLLKEQLKLGALNRAGAHNYFTNLFFSGARFGELLDKETKKL